MKMEIGDKWVIKCMKYEDGNGGLMGDKMHEI